MTGGIKSLGLAILFVAAAIIAAGCSPPTSAEPTPGSSLKEGPSNGLVQSSSGGAVAIEVEWMGEKDSSLVFDVAMDTHSVDLDQYDLGKLAVLRDDEGKEYRPASWRSAPGGHHRSGTLTFPVPDSLGQAKYLELIIRDVAGIKERALKWELE